MGKWGEYAGCKASLVRLMDKSWAGWSHEREALAICIASKACWAIRCVAAAATLGLWSGLCGICVFCAGACEHAGHPWLALLMGLVCVVAIVVGVPFAALAAFWAHEEASEADSNAAFRWKLAKERRLLGRCMEPAKRKTPSRRL